MPPSSIMVPNSHVKFIHVGSDSLSSADIEIFLTLYNSFKIIYFNLSKSNLEIQINEVLTMFLVNITKISFLRFFRP